MNTMSAPMLASRRTSARVTPTCGTNGSCSSPAEWMLRRMRRVYVNVPMNTPSTVWFTRSATKLRSRRGVNWLLASCSATIVTEKTVPVTVMRPPAMAVSTPRVPSAPPPKSQIQASRLPVRGVGICTAVIASATASRTASVGTNQRLSRMRVQRSPRRVA
jgi:hypothetical protein